MAEAAARRPITVLSGISMSRCIVNPTNWTTNGMKALVMKLNRLIISANDPFFIASVIISKGNASFSDMHTDGKQILKSWCDGGLQYEAMIQVLAFLAIYLILRLAVRYR